MANTYSDATGVLIFDGPARITPVIRMLFKPFKLDERPEVEGNERYIAVLSEDNHYDWPCYLNQVVDYAKRLIGLDLYEREDDADILTAIGAHFGASLDALIAAIDFDILVDVDDVVRLAKALDDGHNLQGYCLEDAWHCDRPRLWEFGGWLSFSSRSYAFQVSTIDILSFCRGVEHHLATGPQAAANAISVFARELLDGIVDTTLRTETTFELIGLLQKPHDGAHHQAPVGSSSISRFVAYEIAPVARHGERDCEAHASMTDARAASHSTFWSLYGITAEGPAICIGDFADYAHCADIYRRITGHIAPKNREGWRLFALPASP